MRTASLMGLRDSSDIGHPPPLLGVNNSYELVVFNLKRVQYNASSTLQHTIFDLVCIAKIKHIKTAEKQKMIFFLGDCFVNSKIVPTFASA